MKEAFKILLLQQERYLKEAEKELEEKQAIVNYWKVTIENTKQRIRTLENVK